MAKKGLKASTFIFGFIGLALLGAVFYLIYKLLKSDNSKPKIDTQIPANVAATQTVITLPTGGQYPIPTPAANEQGVVPDGLNEEQGYYKATALVKKYGSANELYNDLKKYGYKYEWFSQLDVAILLYYVLVSAREQCVKDGSQESFLLSLDATANGGSTQWIQDVDFFYGKVFGQTLKSAIGDQPNFAFGKYKLPNLQKFYKNR